MTARTARVVVSAALAVVGLTGLSVATASQLTLTSASMQAGVVAVTGCQTGDVTVAYTYAYDAGTTSYRVATVALSGIATGCQNKAIRVTLVSAAGASLVELTGTTAAGGTTTLTAPATPVVRAEDVAKVAAVVSG
ncbi:hypothetical protein Cch01nite_32910 [Cellulomonas chitinilytica]|uniref:Spore coat protein U domain-containing protein n=1 Tax=Cellulomonas chitinilytica TaxID=398759 RepID=A0A919U3L7_9CELL|nr:hypothetical protein [Cellulomonas chitinilytica]GIG22567.1 hypothetical protein Cch01nite_32910 [Cellulomonas chitinilytica]